MGECQTFFHAVSTFVFVEHNKITTYSQPRNSILAYFDNPRYRRKSSGISKNGTLEMHLGLNIK